MSEQKYTSLSESLSITQLVRELSDKKNAPITFDELKKELLDRDCNGQQKYYINFKENDKLAILYYNDLQNEEAKELELSCRSCIIDKSTMKIIGSQFNKIIYNNDALDYLEKYLGTSKWDQVVVQKCYEGTSLLVYNYEDKWYVSTRRCLNSEDSTWVKGKSYREMFNEAINGKFELDDLNRDYCYHFVLVHHKNKNIVNYSYLGKDYTEVFHTMTTEKYTLNEIKYDQSKINDKIKYVHEESFTDLKDLENSLKKLSKYNEYTKKITTEGYILKVYKGEPFNSPFTILKLQTPIYQKIMKIKPNNSNIHQSYIELYQKDKLVEFLPYFTKYNNDITRRINYAMKNLAKEILDLYHCTRQRKNASVYNNLSEQYKKTLYGLHGLYIEHRKQDFRNNNQNNQNNKKQFDNGSRSINVHDVYHFLKNLPPTELRQLFYERMILLNNDAQIPINKNCIYTKTQSLLMFGLNQ